MTDQPMPKRNKASEPVYEGEVMGTFGVVLCAQNAKGRSKYGTMLYTFNGRDALADAEQELVDTFQYVTQARMEREEIVKRANDLAEAARRLMTMPEGSAGRLSAALAAWDELGLEV